MTTFLSFRALDEHLTNLAQVFDCFKEANLKLQPAKCHFAVKEVKFLGHIISRQGVRVDSDKQQPSVSSLNLALRNRYVASLAWPTTMGGLYKILRKIATLLSALLSKDKRYAWSEQCQVAFETLKEKLISAPILAYPDISKSFILTCDASDSAVGYVLGQIDNDKREYVISYGGKSLSADQKDDTVLLSV